MKLLILLLFSFATNAQKVAVVDFQNDNEQDVINYTLQYQDQGWQDIKTIQKGEDYTFEIPFKAGLYRLLVHQKSSDYYTKVVRLRADEMTLQVDVDSQIILHVESPKRQEVKIILYDFSGRKIIEQEAGLNDDENTLYLTKPAAGLYLIQVIGTESLTQKILIK